MGMMAVSAASRPETQSDAALEGQFKVLAERWRRETAPLCSMTEIVLHPAYQRIVGMGPRALPLIFRELEKELGHWFWALRAITGDNPVPSEAAGNMRRMRDAWLAYARAHGTRATTNADPGDERGTDRST